MKHALQHARDVGLSRNVIVVNYFFNARGAPLERNRLGLLRSLLLQLGHKERSILWELLSIFRERKKMHGDRWEWHLKELENCLLSATRLRLRPVVLLVDALDECEETEMGKMAQFFDRLATSASSQNFNLRVLFSSRHYPNIRIPNSVPIHVEDHNDRDISAYVRQKLAPETSRYHSYPLSEEVIKRASGVFLWVVLVVNVLMKDEDDGETLATKRKRLAEVPVELDKLFEHLLQKTSAAERQETCQLMQWILTALRPLAPSELCHALAFGQSSPYTSLREWETSDAVVKSRDQFERLIRTRSKGLVEVIHDIHCGKKPGLDCSLCGPGCYVQFIHESIRNFLEDKGLQLLDPSLGYKPVGQCHDRVVWSLIRYISFQYLTKQYPPLPLDKMVDVLRCWDYRYVLEQWPLLSYSAEALFRHAYQAKSAGVSQKHLRQYLKGPGKGILYFLVAILRGSKSNETSSTILEWALCFGVQQDLSVLVKILLEQGLDPTQLYTGKPILWFATFLGHKAIVSLLLKRGADIEAKDKYCCTALHDSARRGDKDPLATLLQHSADIEAKDKDGCTALHDSARRGDKDALATLLQHGADVEAKDKDGCTALHFSVRRGDKDALAALLQHGADVEAKDKDGYTALHFSVRRGHKDALAALLQHGADVEAKGKDGCTALHYSVLCYTKDALATLLQHSADIEAKDKDGCTALHYSARRGDKDALATLLQHSADVEAKDKDGCTALHYSARQGHKDALATLLQHGAGVEAKDKDGCTALHYSARRGHKDALATLLQHGADIKAKDHDGCTALHYSAQLGDKDALATLLQYGADVEAKGKDGCTALHLSVLSCNEDVFSLLLEHGADINAEDNGGHTCLHLSAKRGEEHISALLVENGADANKRDKHGYTPADLALSAHHPEIQRFILAHQEKCQGSSLTISALVETASSELDESVILKT